MFAAVWSMKGGVGVSSVAAMLAIAHSERAEETLLVDLDGDQPALLGLSEVDDLGVTDWCASATPMPDALRRIEHQARIDLRILPRGNGPLPSDGAALIDALRASDRPTIVDCGVLVPGNCAAEVAAAADTRLLVARACYLTLRAVRATPVRPTGVVLLRERGRSLGLTDVEAVIDAPIVAEIAIDQAIARSIDAGLLLNRLPRSLVRTLVKVADAA